MSKQMIRFFIIILLGIFVPAYSAHAEIPPLADEKKELSAQDRLSLARSFVQSLSGKLNALEAREAQGNAYVDVSNLTDGEELYFQILMAKERLVLDIPLIARVHKGGIVFSLRDFISATELPVIFDSQTKNFEGWFSREDNPFLLDVQNRNVLVNSKQYELSSKTLIEDEDIFVPIEDLATWFNFEYKVTVSGLLLRVEPKILFPLQERLARKNRKIDSSRSRTGPPILPFKPTEQKLIDVPFVDVSTRSNYDRPGDGGETRKTSAATIRTSGDFAKGTLTTLSQLDREEKLTNFRATYKKESFEPDLLGPLGARKIQIGDVTPEKLTLDRDNRQGMGFRASNVHPLRSFLRPVTNITGDALPGWDVELYRNNQLLGLTTVPDEGIYTFENVELFGSDNNFRVVFYGPQGEIREEELFIPVDPRRLSDMGAAYDVTVMRQGTQTYRKNSANNEDEGSPSAVAYYEVPIGDVKSLSAGLETGQQEGENETGVHAGLTTVLAGTLLNFSTTADTNKQQAAQIVARRDFNGHQFRNELTWNTDAYEAKKDSDLNQNEVLQNNFTVNGPLPELIGRSPKYNLTLNYDQFVDGTNSYSTGMGFSTLLGRIGVNQSIEHQMRDDGSEDTLNSLTQITGSIDRNRLRFLADYKIQPDSELDRVLASVRRRVMKNVDVDLGVEQQIQEKLTTTSARVDWDAGFANISPGLTYNSESDLTATLNTRFGLARNPDSGQVLSFDKPIASNGGASVFVYLDKNGDRIFNNDDEPIPEVVVEAPQNGGRVQTDETGYAFFNRMAELRPTDIIVDPQSLPDPYWISSFEGASIIPRQGAVASLEFPIHISGEIDGTVFAKSEDGTTRPLRGLGISLYTSKGEKIMSSVSEGDGFYLLTKVPPGQYYLVADDDNVVQNAARPLPQKISIDYTGTTVYANNLFFEQGRRDVPIAVCAIDDLQEAQQVATRYILNLGAYKSQLMLGLMWYKIKTFYHSLLEGTFLLQKPSNSFPEGKDKMYILRLAYDASSLEEAYAKCQALAEAGQLCSIEILPGGLDPQIMARAHVE